MPDKEYIERVKAQDGLDNIDWYHVNDKGQLLPGGKSDIETYVPFKAVEEMLKTIPAADVQPVVKAEWYGEADGYADGELVYDMWSCPICGKRFEEWEEKPDWNYCPNCGARMEVDTNDS